MGAKSDAKPNPTWRQSLENRIKRLLTQTTVSRGQQRLIPAETVEALPQIEGELKPYVDEAKEVNRHVEGVMRLFDKLKTELIGLRAEGVPVSPESKYDLAVEEVEKRKAWSNDAIERYLLLVQQELTAVMILPIPAEEKLTRLGDLIQTLCNYERAFERAALEKWIGGTKPELQVLERTERAPAPAVPRPSMGFKNLT